MKANLVTTVPDMTIDSHEVLYLLVDGAQIEHLAVKLYGLKGELDLEPIYLDAPYQELLPVSPYVIRATQSVTDWFLELNEAMAGYFFSSSLTLNQVADGLRSLIKVESPYGSLVFAKMANTECGYILLSTGVANLWQVMNQAWLPTRKGWQHLVKPDALLAAEQGTYKLSDEQWRLLGQVTWCNTLESIENHMLRWFPETLAQQASQPDWLALQAENAYQQGFSSERDLLMFFNVIGFVGLQAVQEPLYADIYQLIHQSSQQTPSQRIEAAANLAYQYSQSQERQA
ncbi:DUF4123 domain-containing protein [Vibrio sp. ABG19]|uniref:DUF4123 domain-containing protein n=1 Tax=Vibrio sp. ABG19 TaxID=2817385 RepID=UPI00249F2AD6|nr:DUF4123 domain-containing protein [Vibrio sp. ABG19]WGY45602.1 DUF4123 domain-containing protein [Vibrio sp. ABG19]